MKNKMLVIICAFCMVFTLVGCSNKSKTPESDDVGSTSTEVVSENSTDSKDDLYTPESVATRGQMTGKVSETTFADMSVKKVQGSEDWEDLTFYIFETEEDAQTALENVKTNKLVEGATVESNYISGQDKDAVDIVVTLFYYQTKNMIIERTDFIGDPGSDKGPNEIQSKNNATRHEQIISNW